MARKIYSTLQIINNKMESTLKIYLYYLNSNIINKKRKRISNNNK
jgi:hypothetical protein